ncbi:hypothetical protein NDN08_003746 [Rhodosorus marinus]|uniref:Retrovirus-related Pol polyprotein from transposon TNT 1-94-like beta-barrel domain-containing protein n=1 Tax=Rhodosorus marinus TaxID=101924 RepID=A0AAV8UK32_9RHOD|nr:hypothetical protein NDN08_003746 [Rhodosorus marinus]
MRARLGGVQGPTQTSKPNEHAIMRMQFKSKSRKREKCGRHNHRTAQCKAHIKYQKCNRYGHFQKECRSKNFQRRNKEPDKETLFALGFSANPNDIVIDSGATSHMLGQRILFATIKESKINTVTLPDQRTISGNEKGTVVIATTVGDKRQPITIEDDLYLPGLEGNYLSVPVPAIVKKGYNVNFDRKGCKFYEKGGAVVASAKLINST